MIALTAHASREALASHAAAFTVADLLRRFSLSPRASTSLACEVRLMSGASRTERAAHRLSFT